MLPASEEIFTISGRKFGKSEENSTACFVKGFDKKGIGLKCEIILELMKLWFVELEQLKKSQL